MQAITYLVLFCVDDDAKCVRWPPVEFVEVGAELTLWESDTVRPAYECINLDRTFFLWLIRVPLAPGCLLFPFFIPCLDPCASPNNTLYCWWLLSFSFILLRSNFLQRVGPALDSKFMSDSAGRAFRSQYAIYVTPRKISDLVHRFRRTREQWWCRAPA